MRNFILAGPKLGALLLAVAAVWLGAGCASPSVPTATSTPKPMPAATRPTVRVKAGVSVPFKDEEGNTWLPETGFFPDGDVTDRPDLKIENTKIPSLYLTERYGMTSFTAPVPNGKYLVKLHFAETFEGITGPGQRVFSFNVQGHEFKDLDIWAKTGGPFRPYIQSVPIDVTDGKVHITFTENVEHPQINGIEIIPQS